eukprot:Awhi_evm1s3105
MGSVKHAGSTCTLRRHHFYPEPQQQQKETITNNHHHYNKENIKPKVGCVHNHDNQDPENINQFIVYLFTKSQVTRSVFMTILIYLRRLDGINQKLTESGQPEDDGTDVDVDVDDDDDDDGFRAGVAFLDREGVLLIGVAFSVVLG